MEALLAVEADIDVPGRSLAAAATMDEGVDKFLLCLVTVAVLGLVFEAGCGGTAFFAVDDEVDPIGDVSPGMESGRLEEAAVFSRLPTASFLIAVAVAPFVVVDVLFRSEDVEATVEELAVRDLVDPKPLTATFSFPLSSFEVELELALSPDIELRKVLSDLTGSFLLTTPCFSSSLSFKFLTPAALRRTVPALLNAPFFGSVPTACLSEIEVPAAELRVCCALAGTEGGGILALSDTVDTVSDCSAELLSTSIDCRGALDGLDECDGVDIGEGDDGGSC